MIREGFAGRDLVRLHYLIHEGSGDLTPLVYMPGALGSAEDFRAEMLRLRPRTTVSVSPRGTGTSDAPTHGYTLGDRVADLGTVLAGAGTGPACLMAFSAGVPVILSFAVRQPEHVKALILLDYPAVSRQYTREWAAQALPFAGERGVPEHVLDSMVRDSSAAELWEDLPRITVPVLLIRGGQSPYVTEGDLSRYRQLLPHLQVELFPDSGHEVFRPDYERFMKTVEGFLQECDRHHS